MELSALAKEAVRVTAMETELTRSWLLVGKMVMSGWEISLRRVGWMEATKGETTLTPGTFADRVVLMALVLPKSDQLDDHSRFQSLVDR